MHDGCPCGRVVSQRLGIQGQITYERFTIWHLSRKTELATNLQIWNQYSTNWCVSMVSPQRMEKGTEVGGLLGWLIKYLLILMTLHVNTILSSWDSTWNVVKWERNSYTQAHSSVWSSCDFKSAFWFQKCLFCVFFMLRWYWQWQYNVHDAPTS